MHRKHTKPPTFRYSPTSKRFLGPVSKRDFYRLLLSRRATHSKHDKIKDDLSDDYTKGSDNYPQTRSQALMLMDHYPRLRLQLQTLKEQRLLRMVIRGRRRVIRTRQSPILPRIQRTSIRSGGKTKSATGVARRGILPQHARSSLPVMATTSQVAHPSPPAKQWK